MAVIDNSEFRVVPCTFMQIIEGYLYEHVGCTDYHSEIQTAGDDPADYEGGERSNNTPGDGFGEVTFWFN